VQRVLDTPVTPDRSQVLIRRPHEAADGVAELHALNALDHATAQHRANRRQTRPQPGVTDPLGGHDHMTLPQLLATTIALHRLRHARFQAREVGLQCLRETRLDIRVQVRLVVLDGQNVIPAARDDLGGDLLLRPHRIDRHQRPGHVEQLQQARDRGDLVGLVVHGHLAQRDVVGTGPGADQVQRRQPLPAAAAAPRRFAINGDVTPRPRFVRRQRRGPTGEATRELLRVQEAEDAAEGVVRRDPVRQAEELPQPVLLGAAIRLHRRPAFGATDDGTKGDADDVQEFVLSRPFDPGVDPIREVMRQGDRVCQRHDDPPKPGRGW
jgi:hypothetical protein